MNTINHVICSIQGHFMDLCEDPTSAQAEWVKLLRSVHTDKLEQLRQRYTTWAWILDDFDVFRRNDRVWDENSYMDWQCSMIDNPENYEYSIEEFEDFLIKHDLRP